MRTFKEILLEKTMTVQQALAVMGLTEVPSLAELKTIYRKLSMQRHPDRGGTVEKMQQLNAAYEVLQKTGGMEKTGDGQKDQQERESEARQKFIKQYEFYNRVQATILADFDLGSYVQHLNTTTGKDWQAEKIVENGRKQFEQMENSGYPVSPYFGGISVRFLTKDKKNSLDFSAVWDLTDAYYGLKNGLAAAGGVVDFDLQVRTTGIINNRKVNFYKQNWKSRGTTARKIKDPNEVFPTNKLKKALDAGVTTRKKPKRQDFIAALRTVGKELSGNDSYVVAPRTSDDLYIAIYREVFVRTPKYTFTLKRKEGILYKPVRHAQYDRIRGLPEEPETLDLILEIPNLTIDQFAKAAIDLHEYFTKKDS